MFSPTGDRYAYHHEARATATTASGGAPARRSRRGPRGAPRRRRDQGFRISDWSPDGARVLYYYEDNYGREDVAPLHQLETVGVAPGSGSIPVAVPRGLVPFAGGSFFPDSQTIVFSAELQLVGPGLAALFRSHSSGRDVTPIRPISSSTGSTACPATPPSARTARRSPTRSTCPRGAASAPRGDLASLVVINADGSGRHVLTHGHRDTRPQWSPDGRMLTFQRQTRLQRDCGSSGACYYEYEVFVIGADGRGEVNFSNDPPYNFAPDWRPARPGSSPPAPPLVTLLADGASLPLAAESRCRCRWCARRGPRLRRGDQADGGQARRVEEALPRARGPLAAAPRPREGEAAEDEARAGPPARHEGEAPPGQDAAGAAEPRPGCRSAAPPTGVAGSPLLFQGRLRAPGAPDSGPACAFRERGHGGRDRSGCPRGEGRRVRADGAAAAPTGRGRPRWRGPATAPCSGGRSTAASCSAARRACRSRARADGASVVATRISRSRARRATPSTASSAWRGRSTARRRGRVRR